MATLPVGKPNKHIWNKYFIMNHFVFDIGDSTLHKQKGETNAS